MCSQVARKAKRAEIFKRAEKFAKEYQDQERDEIRYDETANRIQQQFNRIYQELVMLGVKPLIYVRVSFFFWFKVSPPIN